MERENKALQDKLDKEAKALQEKMNEDNEKRAMESKALADRLEREKQALGMYCSVYQSLWDKRQKILKLFQFLRYVRKFLWKFSFHRKSNAN